MKMTLQTSVTQIVLSPQCLYEKGRKIVSILSGFRFFFSFIFLPNVFQSPPPPGLLACLLASSLPPQGPRVTASSRLLRHRPHFQRSERSLHLTKVVSRFSPCGDTEAASFPQEPATGKTPWCFTRRGFSTPYPLRRTAPENCITP